MNSVDTVVTSKLDGLFKSEADSAHPLDSYVNVIAPENIAFNYRIAGPHRRFFAFFLDGLFVCLFLGLLIVVGAIFSTLLASLFAYLRLTWLIEGLGFLFGTFVFVNIFALWWFYGAVTETLMNGQTFAKRILRLRVLTTDGRPINAVQATARNLLRFADMMPVYNVLIVSSWLSATPVNLPWPPIPTCLVAFAFMLLTERHQRLGDLVCATMVVYEEPRWVADLAIADDPRTPALAEYIPPNFVVSRKMAQALAHYVGQRRLFDHGRRAEIARHLGQPLLRLFGMRDDTSHDLLLCALYYRTFIAKQEKPDSGVMYVEPAIETAAAFPQLGPRPVSSEAGSAPFPQINTGGRPWR